jgi:AbiTii-like protein
MLLDQIIELLSSDKANLTDALLKTKVLLHQIGKKELAAWVNSELNGYPDDVEVPPYRVLNMHVRANFMNPGWRATDHPIPLGHLTPKQRENLEIGKARESLAVLEDLASQNDGGSLQRPIPMEANGILSKGLASGFRVQQAWCQISPHDLKGIVVAVRSRLLDFLLELKSSAGNTATDTNLQEKVRGFDATSLFNNAIFGPNTTIVVGHHNTQTLHNQIAANDFAALSHELATVGVSASEIAELKRAIDQDRLESGKPSLEGKTGNWLTRLLSRAAQGAMDVSVEQLSTVGVRALMAYLGMPSP